MEGAARVFAGEFCRTTCCSEENGSPGSWHILTPGGAVCRRVFVAGALTEVTDKGNTLRCRLADPTGVFELEIIKDGKGGLADLVRKIPVPAFLAVIGRAQISKRNNSPAVFIRPDSVQVIDRSVRDAWILRAADCTLQRIRALASVLNGQEPDAQIRSVIEHYNTTVPDLREMVAMVESAVSGVRPPSPKAAGAVRDHREIIVKIIRDMQGARGIPVEEVIAQAGLRGIEKGRAQETINELIREDECYQPQKGTVRLL